jgi:hypothetical protein
MAQAVRDYLAIPASEFDIECHGGVRTGIQSLSIDEEYQMKKEGNGVTS